ncbi:hypothetical protein ABW20_dc0106809 [Dactylellina cionopaga]|nr:hypothetical protein ABW20_dc0106809 [Dactylellina cionopaga]
MVYASLLPVALSLGLFGLRANAGVIRSDALSMQRRAPETYYGVSFADPIRLPPSRPEDIFPHLRKRADNLSRVELQDELRLTWGNRGVQGRAVADMTLEKPGPNHPLLALESFDDLTDKITCQDKNQKITLKFKTKEVMDRAITSWDWVNQDTSDYFFLITNHAGCGPDVDRHPYKVVSVKYDPSALTTVLNTQTTTWNETAQNYKMRIGGNHPESQLPVIDAPEDLKLAKRVAPLDTLKSIFEFFRNTPGGQLIEGVIKGGNWDVDLSNGAKDNEIPVFRSFENEKVRVDAKCKDCYTTGGMHWDTSYDMVAGVVSELVLIGNPNKLSGKVSLETEIEADLGEGYEVEKLITPPVVNALAIGEIISLGYALQVGPGVEIGLKGIAGFSAGFEWSLPDSARVEIHTYNMAKSTAEGWDGAKFTPDFTLNKMQVEGAITPYAKARIILGIKVGDTPIGVRADFKAGLKGAITYGVLDDEACNGELKGERSTGIKLGLSGDFEVVLAGGVKDTSFDKEFKIWSHEEPFVGKCFADALPKDDTPVPKVVPEGATKAPPSTPAQKVLATIPVPDGCIKQAAK